jgi:hypothetical protein
MFNSAGYNDINNIRNLTKDIDILLIILLILKKLHCLVKTVGLNFL